MPLHAVTSPGTVVTNSVLRHNSRIGIIVRVGGRACMRACDVLSNGRVGVAALDTADIKLVGCRVNARPPRATAV